MRAKIITSKKFLANVLTLFLFGLARLCTLALKNLGSKDPLVLEISLIPCNISFSNMLIWKTCNRIF